MSDEATRTLVDVIDKVTGVAMAEHKAVSLIKDIEALPASKATVEGTKSDEASKPQMYLGKGHDLEESAGGRLIVETYPIYAPVPGITLRIDSQQSSVAARWIDITMDEAYSILADLQEMITEVEKMDAPSVAKPVEKPKPVVEHWWWVVGEFDAEQHPEGKAGQTPVFMSNHRDTPAAWFKDIDNANEIVHRLNDRQ